LNNLRCAKNVIEFLDFRGLFGMRGRHPSSCTARQTTVCGKTQFLPETFEKIRDQGVEIRVVLAEVGDLPDRMDYGRVVFAAEAAANFWQRGVSEGFAQVHRHLPGHGDGLGVVA
jgi:hypothetical protein